MLQVFRTTHYPYSQIVSDHVGTGLYKFLYALEKFTCRTNAFIRQGGGVQGLVAAMEISC
jgi:hypothetical protein